MSLAIKVEQLSKAYQLGQFSTGTLSKDIHRWLMLMRGKEDPFLKIGEANDRTAKGSSDVVWSLKDINLGIEQGDTVGVIGRNGAGKSTLLKILSRVTSPTSGKIKVRGRVASLLEVGTGFHPELTGRENIFLNGAILGMRKREIQRKFDEIVEFAGVQRYIDTPVKRYSSGMYVRLAFAVAAHLESEILIVDEVLAVGDAEFQKKCLGKMGEVSRGEGRTILFVSHNMASLRNLCSTGILLENGRVKDIGPINESIKRYSTDKSLNLVEEATTKVTPVHRKNRPAGIIEILEVEVLKAKEISRNEDIVVRVLIESHVDVREFRIAGSIVNSEDHKVGVFFGVNEQPIGHLERREVKFAITKHNLAVGNYYLSLSVGKGTYLTGATEFDIVYQVAGFTICYGNEHKVGAIEWYAGWGDILFPIEKVQ